MLLFNLYRTYPTKHTLSHILKTPASSYSPVRKLHRTSSRPERINNLTQGHVTNPENLHPQDVQSQSVESGVKAGKEKTDEGIDAASERGKAGEEKKPDEIGKGNPEKIGFVEQVGGASASARKFEQEQKK
ncbi:hypothetical protein D9756_003534 [Leucocoprinus leucothites]|uniref:Uncharacterized protein n=1 Tax=Leucocoprinus leucothites TaxID=201217 RepID=A0A8H5LJ46_9AGAR|nr:hypothetical protein D9756_003534 [Leucoagaricus leucothites]